MLRQRYAIVSGGTQPHEGMDGRVGRDRQTGRLAETGRQADRQTGRHADRQTDGCRQTNGAPTE